MQELFELSSAFENSVVPQEYGTDRDDKRRIGSKMCKALLEKIKYDLTVTMVRALGRGQIGTAAHLATDLSKQSYTFIRSFLHLCSALTESRPIYGSSFIDNVLNFF